MGAMAVPEAAGELEAEEAEGFSAGAGAVGEADRFCRCEGGSGFGAKNFAQARMTTIESSEATRMRSSGRRPESFG